GPDHAPTVRRGGRGRPRPDEGGSMSLREQVVKGGAYLAVREGLGLAVSLGGVLLLTRLIGPANYGLYAGSLGIVLTAGFVGRMGVDVCLVRRAEAPPLAT